MFWIYGYVFFIHWKVLNRFDIFPKCTKPWKVSSCWSEFNGAQASKIMVALFKPLGCGLLKRAISIRMLFPCGATMEARAREEFSAKDLASARQGNPPGEFTIKQPHITMAMRRKLRSESKAKKEKQNVVIMLNRKSNRKQGLGRESGRKVYIDGWEVNQE